MGSRAHGYIPVLAILASIVLVTGCGSALSVAKKSPTFPRSWTVGNAKVTAFLLPKGYDPLLARLRTTTVEGRTYVMAAKSPWQLKEEATGQVLATFPCNSIPPLLAGTGGPYLNIRCDTSQGATGYLVSVPSGKVMTLWQSSMSGGFMGGLSVVGAYVYYDIFAGGAAGSPTVASGIRDLQTGTVSPLPPVLAQGEWFFDDAGNFYVWDGPLYQVRGATVTRMGSLPVPPSVIFPGPIAWAVNQEPGPNGSVIWSLVREVPGSSTVSSWRLKTSKVLDVGNGWAITLGETSSLGTHTSLDVVFPLAKKTVNLGITNLSGMYMTADGIIFPTASGRWEEAVITSLDK